MPRSPIGCAVPFRFLLRLTLTALLTVATATAAFPQANGRLQIHHIKVGQGDGILLISPLGQTALFDNGVYTNCTEIKNYIQGLGITNLNYHFTSHYHADHIGCLDDLAAIGITVGTTGYDRGFSYSSATYTTYVNTLGAKRQTMAANQTVTLDAGAANPVVIRCVNLNGAGVYSPTGSDENAKSMVMKVSYGAFDEVVGGDLTGDGATDVESTIGPQVGDVEVYKVHHHGSRYSTNASWLNAITAEVAVIQCGNGNSYGHPTLDALTRLHAANVKTYWTETGAGVAPDPNWDKVANGAVVIQADPGASDTYTVSGTGFSDTYTNGGGTPPPPPINTTEYPSSLTMLKGSLATGDVTRLAVSDDTRIGVSAGVTGGQYYTDWYGSVFLAHPPLNLTVTCEGSFTVSRTQTLYLWNWSTSAWVQINSATVSTTDVVKTWSTTSPAAYVGPSREVRFRVKGNNRNSTYTSRGDLMSFNYDYTSGTAPMLAASAARLETPHEHGPDEVAHDDHRDREAMVNRFPIAILRRVEATPAPDGARLEWAVAAGEHVDGFNVYRESSDGRIAFVGNEASIALQGEEAVFRFADASGQGGTYWLGARSCSGSEAMIGPIGIEAVVTPAELSFAVAPNPTAGPARLRLAMPKAGRVSVEIFDLQGRRLATPFDGMAEAGALELDWNLTDASGASVGSGIYFARVYSGGRTVYSRITVVGR